MQYERHWEVVVVPVRLVALLPHACGGQRDLPILVAIHGQHTFLLAPVPCARSAAIRSSIVMPAIVAESRSESSNGEFDDPNICSDNDRR
jgi:enterochelin esterase-like enzyme